MASDASPRGPLAARLTLALVAAVACAWFGWVIVQRHAFDGASAIAARSHVSAAQARHAEGLLDTAATLDPGQRVRLTRAQLAADRGDLPRARALASASAHAEPGNPYAWLALVHVSHGTAELAPAFRHLVRLVPPVSSGR